MNWRTFGYLKTSGDTGIGMRQEDRVQKKENVLGVTFSKHDEIFW